MMLNGGLVSWGENYAGSSGLSAPGEGPQEEQPTELVRKSAFFSSRLQRLRVCVANVKGCIYQSFGKANEIFKAIGFSRIFREFS